MPYRLTKARTFESPELQELARWVEDELGKIEEAQEETIALELRPTGQEPERPREGMIVYADGVGWNPGGGAGAYVRTAAAWVKLH